MSTHGIGPMSTQGTLCSCSAEEDSCESFFIYFFFNQDCSPEKVMKDIKVLIPIRVSKVTRQSAQWLYWAKKKVVDQIKVSKMFSLNLQNYKVKCIILQ